eukprot:5814105-Amphidinium_carterae.1
MSAACAVLSTWLFPFSSAINRGGNVASSDESHVVLALVLLVFDSESKVRAMMFLDASFGFRER